MCFKYRDKMMAEIKILESRLTRLSKNIFVIVKEIRLAYEMRRRIG